MSIQKAQSEILIQMALQGMLPLMAQKIMASEAYQIVRQRFAEADALAGEVDRKVDELQAEVRARYKAAQEAMAALLSEQGLQAVVDDLKEARAQPEAEG